MTPFKEGENFEAWLEEYHHGTLILNVKEEGLEERLIALMRQAGIDDYFFLDQSFPFLIRWANKGESRSAVRVSEFENIETALALAGKIKWVWVDYFTHFPLTRNDAQRLQSAGFSLCLVSPELHGYDPEKEISLLQTLLLKNNILFKAVCTKCPHLWETTKWQT